MDSSLKNLLFSLWDKTTPSYTHTRYLNKNFRTMEEYYLALAEYYGIEGGVIGLKNRMINEVNEILSKPENQVCSVGKVRMYDISIEKEMSSTQYMNGRYNGYGNKPTFYFAYDFSDPDNFECPEDATETTWNPEMEVLGWYNLNVGDEIPDNIKDEVERKIKEVCFEDYCVRGMTYLATKLVRNKYGIFGNVEVTEEKNMLGNIKKSKW